MPHLNGLPYPHKPPLLFWLIHAGWWAFGVNEWWPRLVPSLFGLLCLFPLRRVANILWEDNEKLPCLVSMILMGSILWLAFCTFVMFDLLLSFFVLVAIVGGVYIITGRQWQGMVLMGLGLGLGTLSKGPVVFVHTLPVLFLFPWWAQALRRTKSKFIIANYCGAILIGIAIVLAWVIPAIKAGGGEYGDAILWGQTAHRVTSSFAHRRPVWWYMPWLPVLLLPWIFFIPMWKTLFLRHNPRTVLRFCLSWIISTLVIFSILSGKQVYYLLPMLPGVALFIASGLSTQSEVGTKGTLPFAVFMALLATGLMLSPIVAKSLPYGTHRAWCIAGGSILLGAAAAILVLKPRKVLGGVAAILMGSILSFVITEAVFVKTVGNRYDLRGVARILRAYEEQGRPVAHTGKYHGQYHFLGRLKEPFQVIRRGQIGAWLATHPKGRVIAYFRRPPASADWKLLYSHPYRGKTLVILGLRHSKTRGVGRGITDRCLRDRRLTQRARTS